MPTRSPLRTLLTLLFVLAMVSGVMPAVSAQGFEPIDQTTGGASQTVDGDTVEQNVDGELVNDLLAVLIGLLDDLVNPPLVGGPTGNDVLRFCNLFVWPGRTVDAARAEAQRLGLRVIDGNQETVGRFLIQQCATVSPIHNRFVVIGFNGLIVFGS